MLIRSVFPLLILLTHSMTPSQPYGRLQSFCKKIIGKSVDTLSDCVITCPNVKNGPHSLTMKNSRPKTIVERRRTTTRTISIEPHLLSEVKARAAANGQTVSSFIRVLLNREFN